MSERKIRVLMIDDSEDDFIINKRLLSAKPTSEGYAGISYELTWANEVEKGLQQLREHDFDIVLLDFCVPDCANGISNYKRVQAAVPFTPVIILSGLGSAQVAHDAMRCGAQDLLVKGRVDNETLTRAITHAIDRHCNSSQPESAKSSTQATKPPPLPANTKQTDKPCKCADLETVLKLIRDSAEQALRILEN